MSDLNLSEKMNEELKCEYCETVLSSRSALNHHKKTTKYCLVLQNKILEDVSIYKCDDCEYSSNKKDGFNKHRQVCKTRIKRDLLEEKNLRDRNLILEHDIKILTKERDEFKREALKPKITNNLTFNVKQKFFQQYLSPITTILDTLPDEITKRYNLTHFLKGQEGCAELLTEIVNDAEKRRYITDTKSGDVFLYKDDSDHIQTDEKAKLLIEVSKDRLEKSAIEHCKNKIDEANDLFDDDLDTKLKTIKKYQGKLAEVQDISTENIKFRKRLSDQTFISSQTIKTNKEHPENTDSRFALLEKFKPKDINLFLTDKIINDKLSILTFEDIHIFLDIKSIVNFLVEKFLLIDGKLIYKYNQEQDMFLYNEMDCGKLTQKKEKYPEKVFSINFTRLLKKFIMKYKDRSLYTYISNLNITQVRETLIELLLIIEKV